MAEDFAAESFVRPLLDWWDKSGRKDLPWQQNVTPYRVWVSEIMLQQTQVATVERYYERFLQAFPDLATLAQARQDAVLHLWSGLGYYSRARNLHKAARQVVAEHAGVLPLTMDALVALPGIGRSTAGAIIALATGRRQSILDGNAKRVLARYFALRGWSGSTANLKRLWSYAEQCTPQERVANYTQAIMDLGATVCRRSRPACDACPLSSACQALAQGSVADIPAPKPKKVRPQRAAVLLMVCHGNRVLLEKRPASGIWGGLWSFPEFTDRRAAEHWCVQSFGSDPCTSREWPAVAHSFSHFDFAMHPLEVTVAGPQPGIMEGERWLWYNTRSPRSALPAEHPAVGLAAPVARLLEALQEGFFRNTRTS